ncbi:MAG: YhjD/YihY/BrkB family envelope integrity protein [Vicinamibacterales bacterium]
MAVMLGFMKVPLSWRELLRRTFQEAFFQDNCLGMAAQLAYYFFFALFPALLFLVAIASYFPLHTLVDDMFRTLGGFMPAEVLSIITDQLRKISEGEQGGLLTFGMLVTLWSSSGAMTAIIDTLNRAYDIEEGRSWWQVRLIAVALTIGVSVFILISFALVTVGPTFAERIAGAMGLGPLFEWTWKILQWPVVFGLVSVAIAAIYYWGPDAEQEWVWLTPGAVLATLLWIGASLGFKYYVANLGNYTETYGVIGAFMVLMLWFYISGLVILLGAELNAEIEHESPYGKAEGEKVPGERKTIGVAGLRAWVQRRLQAGATPPTSEDIEKVIRGEAPMPQAAPAGTWPPPARPVVNWPPASVVARHEASSAPRPPARRLSNWLIGAGVLAAQMYWAARHRRPRARA